MNWNVLPKLRQAQITIHTSSRIFFLFLTSEEMAQFTQVDASFWKLCLPNASFWFQLQEGSEDTRVAAMLC